jgi:hypothetical protein
MCPRARASRVKIPAGTARMVLARSGGYCAVPSCRRDLFPPIAPGRIATIDQLAHIIGQSSSGPRGADPLPLEARNDGSNIILLCPTCHEIVDDMNATDVFTPEILHQWKRDHERRVRHGAAIPAFETREELNAAVARLLDENHGIWRNLGPESEAATEPVSEAAAQWQDRVLHAIIPNNRRILELIDANRHLFEPEELETVEDFRVHAAALDLNYTSGQRRAGAPRFPDRFPSLFR